MKFIEGICEAVTRALGLSTLSPWGHNQQPVGPSPVEDSIHHLQTLFPSTPSKASEDGGFLGAYEKLPVGKEPAIALPPGPVFAPPNASPGFTCNYTKMKGWRHTGGSGQRNNWLEKSIGDDDSDGGLYNIFTNYDRFVPVGITRKVR